jgi:hypothetical protein
MGKSPPTHLVTLGCVENHFLKDKEQPIFVVEFKLNYSHKYVHSHYQKEINNKELHIVPFWKSMLNVFLSR